MLEVTKAEDWFVTEKSKKIHLSDGSIISLCVSKAREFWWGTAGHYFPHHSGVTRIPVESSGTDLVEVMEAIEGLAVRAVLAASVSTTERASPLTSESVAEVAEQSGLERPELASQATLTP